MSGVKFLYDKIIRLPQQGVTETEGAGFSNKEQTKMVRLWIQPKRSRPNSWKHYSKQLSCYQLYSVRAVWYAYHRQMRFMGQTHATKTS